MRAAPLNIYLLILPILIGKGSGFEGSWENVTYVPVLSEDARRDNDFFNEDSFNEISYSITRPVDFENGTLFSRPTFITEIVSPTLTPVTISRVNHTIRRFFEEETPYYYDPIPKKPMKSGFLERNLTFSFKENETEKKNNSVIQVKNDLKLKESSFIATDEEKNTSLKDHRKAKPRKKRKISDQIRQINKKTEFLIKSIQKIRKENQLLREKLKTAKERQKRSVRRRTRKRHRKPKPKHKKRARGRKTHLYQVKPIGKHKNSGIFEKMRGLQRLERLFQ